MGFLKEMFGIVQSGCKFTDYLSLVGFLFCIGQVTILCLAGILYMTGIYPPTRGDLYLSRAAAIEKLVSAIELEEDVDEALLDICVNFCTQDGKGPFESTKGVGSQDEVYRHYLKQQLRKIEEKRQEKMAGDTNGGAVGVLIDI